MHIDRYRDVIHACRFCFMCRHLDTTANVTFREADIPRGRALILDRIRMNPELLANPDYIRTLYDCALSGACRTHCVSHYDETGLILAARRDLVENGHAPADAKALAESLAADVAPVLEGTAGDLLYVESGAAMTYQPEIAGACERLFERAGIGHRTLRVSDVGKGLLVLGFAELAAAAARRVRECVEASRCRTLVTSCPATFDALRHDFPALGVPLEGVDIQHTSTYLLGLVRDGQLTLPHSPRGACYIDSDFLRNYNDITGEPRELLRAAGYALTPFGTNPEESYALGEGAVVLDRLRPDLVRRLRARFVAQMDSPDTLIVTAGPYTRRVLAGPGEDGIGVLSIEEAVAGV